MSTKIISLESVVARESIQSSDTGNYYNAASFIKVGERRDGEWIDGITYEPVHDETDVVSIFLGVAWDFNFPEVAVTVYHVKQKDGHVFDYPADQFIAERVEVKDDAG